MFSFAHQISDDKILIGLKIKNNREHGTYVWELAENHLIEPQQVVSNSSSRVDAITWCMHVFPTISTEVLVHGICIFDRYVYALVPVSAVAHRLSIAAAIGIASKWHEDDLDDMLQASDIALATDFAPRDIGRREEEILRLIDYCVWFITPIDYLLNCRLTPDVRTCAADLIEVLTLCDSYSGMEPSTAAILCIYFAHLICEEKMPSVKSNILLRAKPRVMRSHLRNILRAGKKHDLFDVDNRRRIEKILDKIE